MTLSALPSLRLLFAADGYLRNAPPDPRTAFRSSPAAIPVAGSMRNMLVESLPTGALNALASQFAGVPVFGPAIVMAERDDVSQFLCTNSNN